MHAHTQPFMCRHTHIHTHLGKGAGHIGKRSLVDQEEESLCWVQLEAAAAQGQGVKVLVERQGQARGKY